VSKPCAREKTGPHGVYILVWKANNKLSRQIRKYLLYYMMVSAEEKNKAGKRDVSGR